MASYVPIMILDIGSLLPARRLAGTWRARPGRRSNSGGAPRRNRVGELKSLGKPFRFRSGLSGRRMRRSGQRGAPGVDGVSIEEFEKDLKGNLYKIWNRMSSGTYFPPPVVRWRSRSRTAAGTRILGVPTVADRVAQTVVARVIEERAEQVFHPDSYGYRPGRSALDAVGACRERCWRTTGWSILTSGSSWMHGHTAFVHCHGQNSPCWGAGGSIRRPFLRPVRTWTARSSPSLTRCMMVWRETP